MTRRNRTNVLTDIYRDWVDGGIITTITSQYPTVPWHSTTDGKDLDLEYYGNHSGQKYISPLVQKLLTETGLSDANKLLLAKLIYTKFHRAWEMRWKALHDSYNPLENYNMIEREDTENSYTKNDSMTGGSTTEQNSSGTNSASGTSADNNKTYGFNSTSAVNTDSEDTTFSNTGNSSNELTGTYTRNETNAKTGTDTTGRDLNRHGNIGTVTTQNMVSQELELREWNFFLHLFEDIDTVLVIEVYGENSDTIYYNEPKYTLPVASSSVLGGVKIGRGITETADGKISVSLPEPYELPVATETTLGGVKIGDGITESEDGTISVETVEPYELPVATETTLGGVKLGTEVYVSGIVLGVGLDENGKLSVTVPTADGTTEGTVHPVPKTEAMTQEVGVDDVGELWCMPYNDSELNSKIEDLSYYSKNLISLVSLNTSTRTVGDVVRVCVWPSFNKDTAKNMVVSFLSHVGYDSSTNKMCIQSYGLGLNINNNLSHNLGVISVDSTLFNPETDVLDKDTPNAYVRYSSSTNPNGATYSWRKANATTLSRVWYTRSFIDFIVDGVTKYVYGNLYRITINEDNTVTTEKIGDYISDYNIVHQLEIAEYGGSTKYLPFGFDFTTNKARVYTEIPLSTYSLYTAQLKAKTETGNVSLESYIV